MKTIFFGFEVFLISIVIFMPAILLANDFVITFSATGASTTFDNVIVQNLTQDKTVTVTSGSSLNLIDATAISNITTDKVLEIFPVPVTETAKVLYNSEQGGNTQIEIIGIDGKIVFTKSEIFKAGINSFELILPIGVYTIIFKDGYNSVASKVISNSNKTSTGIYFSGCVNMQNTTIEKSKRSDVPFTYIPGDIFLFKAKSGDYSCVVAEKITESKNINFNFVPCKDADGNNYATVTIGTQVWMAENLKTMKYRNGNAISYITDNDTWMNTKAGAWCRYNNDVEMGTKFGYIYNFYAVNDSRNIAPAAWHIPSLTEWRTMITYLGNYSEAGGKLKEYGILNWKNPNIEATNLSGFTALPGGYRYQNGTYTFINEYAYWWCSSKFDAYNSDAFFLNNLYKNIFPDNEPFMAGLYIRCVKD